MKQIVIFFTPFNRAKFRETSGGRPGVHPTLTRAWILPRFDFWKRYTLQSILNQAHEEFFYAFCCDAKTQHIIQPLMQTIDDKRVVLDLHESDQSKNWIRSIGKNYDRIYTIRLDSDDLYHPEVASEVLSADCPSAWYYFRVGYAYHYHTRTLWYYDCRGTGPFFAHRYDFKEDFAKKNEVNEIAHNEVRKKEPLEMSKGKFLVSLTGMNTTTTLRTKTIGQEIEGDAKERILDQFGIL